MTDRRPKVGDVERAVTGAVDVEQTVIETDDVEHVSADVAPELFE